jgi:hypothetical protein
MRRSQGWPTDRLQQQFGDLDVRQGYCGLVDQGLRGVGHRRVEEWRDLQSRLVMMASGVWPAPCGLRW